MGEARCQPQFRNIGRRSLERDTRLQDQSLGDPLIVFRLDVRRQVPLARQEGGGVHLPPVRRQPLEAQHQMRGVLPVFAEILADASLHIPERRDRTAVERLDLALDRTVEIALALGLPPEPIDVSAGPSGDVPGPALLAVVEADLKPVDDDGGGAHVAVLAPQPFAGRGHPVRTPDGVGRMSRAGQGGRRRGRKPWAAGIVRAGRHVRRGCDRLGAHVMAGVKVGAGGHHMTGVRIRGLGRRAHVMPGVRVGGPGRRGHDVACVWIGRRGLDRGPRGRRMPAVILGGRRSGDQQQGSERGHQADHAAPPSSGRTVTTLNIPACMCISMWQWKAQSPGASAVRSNVTFEPGATLTVCFSG